MGLLGAGCLLLAASPALSLPTEQITNGDFETGDFTGWTNMGSGSGFAFTINDGTFDPSGPGVPAAPIGGRFDAVSSQTGPGLNLVSQQFVVPANIAHANISWDDRIQNFSSAFSDPNQEFRVLVQDALGVSLFEVFSTNPGDPLSQPGPNSRAFDITPVLQGLSGQLIQIAFEQQDNLLWFNATVDNISLTTRPIPEPGAAMLFGLGSLVVGLGMRRRRSA